MSELEFPIADDVTHALALAEAYRLISSDVQKGTYEADLLDWLAERIEAYEKQRWPEFAA